MPYSTQADYLPIPPGAMGTLFDPDRLKKGYVTQEIGDGVHYVTSGGYDAMFVQTGKDVIVVDTPRVRDDRLEIKGKTRSSPRSYPRNPALCCYRMIRFYFAGADFKCPALG